MDDFPPERFSKCMVEAKATRSYLRFLSSIRRALGWKEGSLEEIVAEIEHLRHVEAQVHKLQTKVMHLEDALEESRHTALINTEPFELTDEEIAFGQKVIQRQADRFRP